MFQYRQVLVVDNSKYFEQTWNLLMPEKEFGVIGPVDYGTEAIKMVTDHSPDIVLVDLCCPRANGLQTISSLHATWPDLPVIALASTTFDEDNRTALEAGAVACLEKSELATSLLPTIDRAAPARMFLPKDWSDIRWMINELLDTQIVSVVRQYIVYTGLGLAGGALGATLAIWLVSLVQSLLPPTTSFLPGTIPLIMLTILMSLIASWWLYRAVQLALPRLSPALNGQAIHVILVSSMSTGILEVFLFTQGWGLY